MSIFFRFATRPFAAAFSITLSLLLSPAYASGNEPLTANSIRALTASFTQDSLPELLSALHASNPRCREEALIILQSLPAIPTWEEAPLIEAAIDGLSDASDTVRFQAVKTLALRFPKNQRTREAVLSLATSSVPADLLGWAFDAILEGNRRSTEARQQLKRISSEADARLREHLREQPLFESASRTRDWLLKDPAVQAVDLSRDCLWFSTRDGLESGLLLDSYRSLATQTKSASATTPAAHFPARQD